MSYRGTQEPVNDIPNDRGRFRGTESSVRGERRCIFSSGVHGCEGRILTADLWAVIPFRFGTPYWTAIGQSTCRFVFGATCPINETSIGNDDPNQPHIPLLCPWAVAQRSACSLPPAFPICNKKHGKWA